MACIKVVTSHSKGRCAVAPSCVRAGQLVLSCEALAAVLDEDSDMFDERTMQKHQITRAERQVMRPGFDRSALLCRRVLMAIERASGVVLSEVHALCDNLALRTEKELEMYHTVAKYICWSLPSDSRFKADEDGVVRMLSTLACNAFSICDFEFREQGIGFYPAAAVFNHACDPNCVAVFDQTQLQIRAVRTIRTDEELTISYTEQARPPRFRRAALWEAYRFHCMCNRCCIADDLAELPCPNPDCSGSLEPEMLSIHRFHEHQSMRLAAASPSSSSSLALPLPGWVVDATHAGTATEQLEPLRCTGCGAEQNSLVQCLRDLQLCDALFREGRKLLKEGRRVDGTKNLKRSLKLAKAWLRPNGCAVLEILGALAMAYTEVHDFESATRYAEAALPCFYVCYPQAHCHPMVAVQQLFVAKLLDSVASSRSSDAEAPQIGRRILQLLAAALPVLQSTQPMHEAQLNQARLMFDCWRSRFPQLAVHPTARS